MSAADRPPAPARRHRAPSTVLAATAAIVALLGMTGIAWWTGQHHVSARSQANSLFVDTLNVFDSNPALPPTQVSTATVTDVGPDPATITDVEFTLTPPPSSGGGGLFAAVSGTSTTPPPPTVPFVIFPGENCKGAVLQPKQDCMVSVRYTNPGQIFHGSIIVTTADGSTVTNDTGANQSDGLDQLVADPYVADFGTRPVGQTSAPQTITIGASPDGQPFQVVGVSVVDTVPTPGDRADYDITADNCTNQELELPRIPIGAVPQATTGPVANCTVQVTDTPDGSGPRPAFLSVSFCGINTDTVGTDFPPNAVPNLLIQPDTTTPADTTTQSTAPTTTPAPPPPPNPNVFCPNGDNQASFHQIVALDGAGQSTSTTPPTTPPTTTTPPPTTTTPPPPPTFTPTLTALPPLTPADRTTQVSGTGFPVNTPVIFALVALNTPPDANLSSVADAVTTTTDGNGDFTDKVMLIMPHTPPGQYEILAQAQFGKVPETATVPFLVAPGSQEPPKFVVRH